MSKRESADLLKDGHSIFVKDLDELGYTPEAVVNWVALMGWSYDGKVTDAKTLVATLWLHNVLNGTWRLNWFSGDAPEGQHPSPSGPYQPTLTARP